MITDSISSQVQGYIDGVIDGSIVACESVRHACARHVRDLERQSSELFPYHFDATNAADVCRFFPLFLRHTIGSFAGLPLDLQPFQLFIIWNIFGWLRDDNNSRRFRKAFLTFARKNGKSTTAAGIAHYMAIADIDPATWKAEAVGQVLLSATKKDQAEIVYSECERMRAVSPTLKRMSQCKNKNIIYNHTQSFIRPMGSDKPFDGMNPSCVINDELHAWKEFHRKFWDTMVTGSAYRTHPLQIIITTAGDDQSHLWKEQYTYASGVANGTIVDESVFAFIAELDEKDDPFDESVWPKANPNLGVTVDPEYLRQQVAESKHNPSKRNQFIRYHCNRIVSSNERAFDLAEWDACAAELSDWSTADAIGAAFDLGGRDDLAASAYCARWHVGEKDDKPIWRYEIKSKTYIADECNRDLTQQPWASWIYYDHLHKSRFPIAALRDDLFSECNDLSISLVAYDPYSAQQLGDECQAEGLTPVRMAQNYSQFNEPIKEFMQAIADGRLKHDGKNPLLRWCAGNAVISRDRNDRWMFDKRDSNEKIDPIVAVVMAFRICALAPTRASGSLFIT